jgi:hypothetical protein
MELCISSLQFRDSIPDITKESKQQFILSLSAAE